MRFSRTGLICGLATGAVLCALPVWGAEHNERGRTVSELYLLSQAVQDGRRSGRTVLMDFYANWCLPSKGLEKMFRDGAVQLVRREFVKLNLNLDYSKLDKPYNITSVPTLIFLDANGKEKKRVEGMDNNREWLLSLLCSQLSAARVAAIRERTFGQPHDLQSLALMAVIAKAQHKPAEAMNFFERARAEDPESKTHTMQALNSLFGRATQ